MSESDVYDFEALCTPHYGALVCYANRLLPGRSQEARDLVQEAYLKAYRRWRSWRPRTGEDPIRAARGWLHRILQRVFLDAARMRVGHGKAMDLHMETVMENTHGIQADHNIQLLHDGVGDEVRAALASLDADQRAVVEKADFQGEQYLAIAEALHIPLGTVMSRLHRGRKRLAAALRSYARETYGIAIDPPAAMAEGTRTDIKAIQDDAELDSAGPTALTNVATESVQADSHTIDCVVTWHDDRDLLWR